MSRRCTLVKLALVDAIQIAIRQEEEELKIAPARGANIRGCSQPVVIYSFGRISLMNLVVFDAVQHSLWIEKEEFENLPSS